jgi:hypothetical protein
VKEYTVSVNGIEHTMLLSEEDAKARGLTADSAAAEKAKSADNKARTAPNK